MAWRDGVFQGSWRGVPFFWGDEAGGEHGRRIVKHEFPNRNTSEGEDLGRKPRSFSLDVFILENDFNDYTEAKAALISACEAKGMGQLVHPTMGAMLVYGEGCRWRESTDQMGKCEFQLTFWDPASTDFVAFAVAPDQSALVDDASDLLQAAALASFLARFSVLGFIAAVMDTILGPLGGLCAALEQVAGLIGLAVSVADAVGFVSGQAVAVVAWFATLNALQDAGAAILATPSVLASQIASLIAGLPYLPPSNTVVPIASWADIRSTGPVGAGLPPQSLAAPPPVEGFSQQTIDGIHAGLISIASLGLAAEATLDGPALAPITAALLGQITPQAIPGASAALAASVALVPVPGVTPVLARQIAATYASSASGASAGTAPGPLANAPASPVPGVTLSRVQMAINQIELIDLVRRLTLAQGCQAVASSVYQTVEAAEAARDDIAGRLDLEMQLTTDDGVYQALAGLRIAVVQQINATIANLPMISTIVLPTSVPALVLAHLLYDDPSWADDIIARNDIPHPGFVPAGVALQVLADV